MNSNRNEEEQKRTLEIYDAYRDDLRKRQLSNTENYDKTILTLSSSGLALSLTAIKFAIPLATASYLCLIQGSWWLFGTTILISIIAYWVGNKALDTQLKIAEDYYSKGNEAAFSKKNWYSTANDWLNIGAGFTFLIATALIISFVTLNINGELKMSNKTDRHAVMDSACVTKMQSINNPASMEKRSATVPAMQATPIIKPASPQTTQGTSGNKPNGVNRK
jgi:hypothetical protein